MQNNMLLIGGFICRIVKSTQLKLERPMAFNICYANY